MSIVLSQAGATPIRLNRTMIADESYLQQYIYDHPETLPFDQIQEEARPLVLIREFPTPSGPIDALATDGSAHLYLIETKLYKNPDKRLVLAQVLDYGAALWKAYKDPDDFITRLDSLMTGRGGASLATRLEDAYSLEGQALADFTDDLKEAIATGEFRFVVLMDRIDDRLKDLITYVNANSAFALYGVGLDFYEHQDMRILIPTLYGAEVKKPGTTSASDRRTWDADSVLADAAERLSDDAAAAVRTVHGWSVSTADRVTYGTGKKGSFTPKFTALSARGPISVYSNGTLQLKLNPNWFADSERGSEFHAALVRELTATGLIPSGLHTADIYLKSDQWRNRVDALTRALSRAVSVVA